MTGGNRFWDRYPTFAEAEAKWDEPAERLHATRPLKALKRLPNMPGIKGGKAGRRLRWRGFGYVLAHDKDGAIRAHVLKRPWSYGLSLARSFLKRRTYVRDGDFYLYGFRNTDAFKRRLADPATLLVAGFSYCHKPFECPSGRFTDACIHEADHPVCRQCFIGKCVHALPRERTVLLIIPTVNWTVEKLFEVVERHPTREVLFVITACELTLEMFGDGGNLVGVKGIGVRLDGQICNTMRAFELSEEGIKPGLTLVLDRNQRRMLDLFALRREAS